MSRPRRSRILILAASVAFLASAALAQPLSRWAPFGPGGGTPTGLAVDPRDPSVIYAAADTLYRSVDGGETWTALFGPNFTAVAVDPANPSAVYAGGRQLARSTNGGRSWQTTLASGVDVSSLAVVPGKPSTVLAASGFQLFRSADGGRTWSSRFVDGTASSVVADPGSPGTAYYTDASGVHKSTDAGRSWSFSGPSAGGRPVPYGLLAVSPRTLYLRAATGEIYRSADGARSWQRTGAVPVEVSLDKALLVDPASPSRLYLAGYGGIFRSPDGGATWERLDGGLPQLPFDETLAVFALAADPSRPGSLYAGTYQHGVAKSADGGQSWDLGVEPGLSGGPLALLEIDPRRPDTAYVGLANAGDRAFRSTDGGRTWEAFNRRIARDGLLDLAFDPADPDTLYAANGKGLWKSRDDGETWERLDGSTFYRIAVSTPGTLLAGRDCGLSRSTDDGRTWKTVIPCFLGDELTVFTVDLRVDPENPRALYALMVATNGASGYDRLLARSTDGGATWKTLEVSPSSFAVAPGDFQTLYAVDLRGGNLLRSGDGGESWRTVHSRLPYPDAYGALAVDAADPDTLYAGTVQKGVLRSRNGGVTLRPLGAPFDASKRAAVASLFTDRDHPGVVWAAPFNGGLFWGRFE
ncbi:MAG: WD40/YVTN/BNR-like repeat-containing protein [Thermoanaerobaculia bacterium]